MTEKKIHRRTQLLYASATNDDVMVKVKLNHGDLALGRNPLIETCAHGRRARWIARLSARGFAGPKCEGRAKELTSSRYAASRAVFCARTFYPRGRENFNLGRNPGNSCEFWKSKRRRIAGRS